MGAGFPYDEDDVSNGDDHEFKLVTIYASSGKEKERSIKENCDLDNFSPLERISTPLRVSIDDDSDWDPLAYEEQLLWSEPDPCCLEQLHIHYDAEEPYEDGQFDDVGDEIESGVEANQKWFLEASMFDDDCAELHTPRSGINDEVAR